MANIKLDHIYKVYPNGVKAVSDFTMDIKDKEFIVFVGPSGCGKSTTLRMIAGLEDISAGELYIDDRIVNDVEPKDRDIAMVFQNYALYPHMTVYENMAFGLQLRHVPTEEIHERVLWAANILGLTDYLDRKPRAMSGGQRQRVALGRAIIRNAKIFLMDEPLSNLDAKLRVSMRSELIKIHRQVGATTIYVTHDQIEAMTMADRIVVMSMGRVQQIGTPDQVYNNPNNMFVASFIGTPPTNFFAGRIEDGHFIGEGIDLKLSKAQLNLCKGYDEVILGIRPEHVLGLDGDTEINVELVEHLGSYSLLHGIIGQHHCVFKVRGWSDIQSNSLVKLKIDMDKVYFFNPADGQRLRGE